MIADASSDLPEFRESSIAAVRLLQGVVYSDDTRAWDALLTNDTGTLHLAAYLGRRVVAVFGSTDPAWTGPLGAGHRVIRHHVECSPCFLRDCPMDFRCMEAVTPAEVAAAVVAVVSG